jgi:hypothetical protein
MWTLLGVDFLVREERAIDLLENGEELQGPTAREIFTLGNR